MVEPLRPGIRLATLHERALFSVPPLVRFYESRDHLPAWFTDSVVRHHAITLLDVLQRADDEGLSPEHYHARAIDRLLGAIRNGDDSIENLVHLDLLLTDAFLTYGSHLLAGHINPEALSAEWFIARPETDLEALLTDALSRVGIRTSLESLRPTHPDYRRLTEALRTYRTIAERGGWPVVPDGKPIGAGSSGERVRSLRARLAITGDLEESGLPATSWDSALERAVRKFQRRHGLAGDGVVGPATLAELNVPVEQRIDQMLANLERWRWLPVDLGPRFIMVNIADFMLHVVDDSRPVMTMKVVVGRSYRRTPVASGEMTNITFRPAWNVPEIIAATDVLQKVKRDRSYLSRNRIRVFRGGKEVDPGSIDWSRYSEASFPFTLRQEPGAQNALGRVRFNFDNRFNLYLHDTPERELFAREMRDYSSGCIRIERPVELAAWLLGGGRWSSSGVSAAMNEARQQTVALPRNVPVHILYWTAWVAPDGTVAFRRDIYHRDERLIEAFQQRRRENGVTIAWSESDDAPAEGR